MVPGGNLSIENHTKRTRNEKMEWETEDGYLLRAGDKVVAFSTDKAKLVAKAVKIKQNRNAQTEEADDGEVERAGLDGETKKKDENKKDKNKK